MRHLTLLFSLALASACHTPSTIEVASTEANAVARPGEIDVEGFAALQTADTVFVDVRTPAEYGEVHAVGTVNIPLDQIDARLGELETHRSETIYLICRSGSRSAAAAKTLAGRGFKTVNILGGTSAWQSAGLPTEP